MNYFVKQDIPYLGLTEGQELVYDSHEDGYVIHINEEHIGEYGTTTTSHSIRLSKSYLDKFPENFEAEFVKVEPRDEEEPFTPAMRSEVEIENRISSLAGLISVLEAEVEHSECENEIMDLVDILDVVRAKYATLNWVLNKE